MNPEHKSLSPLKLILFWTLLLAMLLLGIELLSSTTLFHYYRVSGLDRPTFSYSKHGQFATLVLVNKFVSSTKAGKVMAAKARKRVNVRYEPDPFFVRDEWLGYSTKPGTYKIIFDKPNRPLFVSNVQIMEDGSRATGYGTWTPPNRKDKKIILFGDSFVFGWGVNDPHTLAWALQEKYPNYRVYNYAVGGYGNIHNYLRLKKLKDEITSEDILLFGYADYYNSRNVGAPSLIKAMNNPFHLSPEQKKAPLFPYAFLSKGELLVDYVAVPCDQNDHWCEQPDPSLEETYSVTKKIFSTMNKTTQAQVAVLFLSGKEKDPIVPYLNTIQIPVVDLRASDTVFQWDNIDGYDSHPGPVAHYYYAEKIEAFLTKQGWADQPPK